MAKMFHNLKKCAIIEARLKSTRLPGKVLLNVQGKPILQHIIERLRRSKYLDDVIVATSVDKSNNPIESLCKKIKCICFRGSEEDVLLRVLKAAEALNIDLIIEITGDCPCIDWRHVDYLIELFFSGHYDYVSNTIERTFPDGFDVQVFPLSVLKEVNNLTESPVDHEHVSLYIYTHPEKFRLLNWKANDEMYHPEMHITLDTPEDYELIKLIYNNLYPKNEDFNSLDVINLLLNKPELLDIVKNIRRKDALKEQKEWLEKNEK